jgi:hypothetical protein
MVIKLNLSVNCQECMAEVECSMHYDRGIAFCPQFSGKVM